MPPGIELLARLEQYALLSLEKQDKLNTLVDDNLHELDLDAGAIRFGALEFSMQVIGTESDNTLTWLWAWADEQTDIPTGLLQSAIQLRNWGAAEGISEYTMPSMDLDRAEGQLFSMIASEVCSASCYYQDLYEGGSVFVLLFDKRIDNLPSFDRLRLFQRMTELFSRYELNHRNTLLSYFTRKGLSPVVDRDLVSCELESGERVNAEFDESGRLTAVNGTVFQI